MHALSREAAASFLHFTTFEYLYYSVTLCSQTLFKEIRHKHRSQQEKPVTVHINYHPDKNERQRAVMKYFLGGDDHALDAFPGGSEPGS